MAHQPDTRREQFERLVSRHKDSVYRQMLRLCQDKDDAEDALADAILSAYSSRARLKSSQNFQAWLSIIARRACAKMRKREALARLDAAGVKLFIDPEKVIENRLLESCVLEAVAGLPEIYRSPYLLCEIEEHSLEDAAVTLGLTLPGLKSRLHRARKMVRDALDRTLCGTL